MVQINNPHIVRLYAMYEDSDHEKKILCAITEYVGAGNLQSLLHNSKKKLPFEKICELALGIAHGVEYLHDVGILHRDLKSANILLDENMRPKIADFNLAKIERNQNTQTFAGGTAEWMAPEVFYSGLYTPASDIYSLGVIFWEMVSRKDPYGDEVRYKTGPAAKLMEDVRKGKRPKIPSDTLLPYTYTKLIEQCWATNPQDRPTIKEIIRDLESLVNPQLPVLIPTSETTTTCISPAGSSSTGERTSLLHPSFIN